jgi:hypothetical protein
MFVFFHVAGFFDFLYLPLLSAFGLTDKKYHFLYSGYEFRSSDVAASNEKRRGRFLDAGSAGGECVIR